jgi:PAS domain-containing protein
MHRKFYTPPRMIRCSSSLVPESILESCQKELAVTEPSRPRVAPACTTVVDSDRRYVWVSDNFCELLGYKSEELIGKRYDEVTAANTSDIPVTYSMFRKLGYVHGLWMLVHRTEARILIS